MYYEIRGEWKKHHIACRQVANMLDAMRMLKEEHYLLIIAVIPRGEAAFVLRQLSVLRSLSDVPLILITHEPMDTKTIVQAYHEGADDLQQIPYTLEEAVAKGQALIRRYTGTFGKPKKGPSLIFHQGLIISRTHRRVYVGYREISLSRKEFDLLYLLIQHQGRVLSYRQIYRHVWGLGYEDSAKEVLRTQIYRLRDKLQIDPALPEFIRMEYGVGYSFDPQFDRPPLLSE